MSIWNFGKKQEQEPPKNIEPILVGVDLGYGHVKVASGKKRDAFISAVGSPISTFGRKSPVSNRKDLLDRLEVEWNGQTYYLGKNAITNTRNGRLTLRQDKTATDHNIVKFITALALMTDEDQTEAVFNVVTGLPVLEYKNEADNLANTLLNGGKPFVFNMHYGPKAVQKTLYVKDVEVISQGEGAFYHFLLNDEGKLIESREKLATGRVMVVDMGYRTTDIVTMENASYIETLSDQLNKGVNQIHQEVLRLIMERMQIKKELKEMDEIVRTGQLFHNTKTYDVKEIINDVANVFAEDILENLHIISNDQLGAVNFVIFTGGGGEIIYPSISSDLKNVVDSAIMDTAQYSNAIGYHKYGLLLKSTGQMG